MRVILLFLLSLGAFYCQAQFGGSNRDVPFDIAVSGHGGRAVILIPGFACRGEVWKETLAHLDQRFKCYTLSMAGFAGVQPRGGAGLKEWESAIAAWIQRDHIERPIIIGHSLGGLMAMALAADHPEIPSGIVVVDALPCLPALMNPRFQPKENNDCSTMIQRLVSMPDSDFFRMQKMTASGFTKDSSRQAEIVKWSMSSDRNVFGRIYCEFTNTDLRQRLVAIECPALVLLETSFKAIDAQIGEQYRTLRGASLKYSDKSLHFIMYDDTNWYLDQLDQFAGQ